MPYQQEGERDGEHDGHRESLTCPHCGADLAGKTRRYFNWVEIDQPPKSDLAVLLPWLAGALAVVIVLGWLAFRWLG